MSTTIAFDGPSIQRRIITKDDLVASEVEFKDGEELPDMVWEPGEMRRKVTLPDGLSDSTVEQIKSILEREGTFTVRVDGEIESESKAGSDQVAADGSNKATGEGGSPVLASTLGSDATSGAGRTGTTGGSTAGTATTGGSTRTSTTGGSTAGS